MPPLARPSGQAAIAAPDGGATLPGPDPRSELGERRGLWANHRSP
jgi:hypothetical protein